MNFIKLYLLQNLRRRKKQYLLCAVVFMFALILVDFCVLYHDCNENYLRDRYKFNYDIYNVKIYTSDPNIKVFVQNHHLTDSYNEIGNVVRISPLFDTLEYPTFFFSPNDTSVFSESADDGEIILNSKTALLLSPYIENEILTIPNVFNSDGSPFKLRVIDVFDNDSVKYQETYMLNDIGGIVNESTLKRLSDASSEMCLDFIAFMFIPESGEKLTEDTFKTFTNEFRDNFTYENTFVSYYPLGLDNNDLFLKDQVLYYWIFIILSVIFAALVISISIRMKRSHENKDYAVLLCQGIAPSNYIMLLVTDIFIIFIPAMIAAFAVSCSLFALLLRDMNRLFISSYIGLTFRISWQLIVKILMFNTAAILPQIAFDVIRSFSKKLISRFKSQDGKSSYNGFVKKSAFYFVKSKNFTPAYTILTLSRYKARYI